MNPQLDPALEAAHAFAHERGAQSVTTVHLLYGLVRACPHLFGDVATQLTAALQTRCPVVPALPERRLTYAADAQAILNLAHSDRMLAPGTLLALLRADPGGEAASVVAKVCPHGPSECSLEFAERHSVWGCRAVCTGSPHPCANASMQWHGWFCPACNQPVIEPREPVRRTSGAL